MNTPAIPAGIRPANFTRTTPNLTARYFKTGRWHLIPLLWLLRRSDFAREGIERSGSYLFADHLYRNVASGRGWFGRWLDRRLLNLPSARGMRARYSEAVRTMMEAFASHQTANPGKPFRILTVPCGIPRDVADFVSLLPTEQRSLVEYTACDIDPEVIAAARRHLENNSEIRRHFRNANALDPASLDEAAYDFISSTGLGEFLDDSQLGQFYGNIHRWLAPGGVFYTSATKWERRSAWLLKTFELHAHYRDRDAFAGFLETRVWTRASYWHDATGLQTFVRAVK
jgi:SAM-dependent methyltransferase